MWALLLHSVAEGSQRDQKSTRRSRWKGSRTDGAGNLINLSKILSPKNSSYYLHTKVSVKLSETGLFLTPFSPAHCDSLDNSSDMLIPYHESLTRLPPVLVLPCPEFQSSGIYAWCGSHLQGVGSSENGTEMHRTASSCWGRFFLLRNMSEKEVTFLLFMNVSAKLLSTSSSREVKALGSATLHLFYPVSSLGIP